MHLPEVQQLEDPQNESADRAVRPMRMALRNSAAALVGIGLIAGGLWVKRSWGGDTGPVYWWIWPAVAAFAVVVCFVHAMLAAYTSGRWASVFMKAVAGLVLAGMLFAVWWSVQPKGSGI